jgi:formate dehydrogenase subunit delta
MADTSKKLVYMANQIATFFTSQPKEQVTAGIATHINKFWDPRMRRQLFEIIEKGGDGLLPSVLEAAAKINRPKAQDAA